MREPPRPRGEGVITRHMWTGILFVGFVMAVGTLLVLDASLPAGLIEGSGTIRYGQTMAFTTLVMFQLFNAFNAHSDEQSALHGLISEENTSELQSLMRITYNVFTFTNKLTLIKLKLIRIHL